VYVDEKALQEMINSGVKKKLEENVIDSQKVMSLAESIRLLIKDSPKSIVNKAIHIAKCSLNWD
jgi:hypothetical protein